MKKSKIVNVRKCIIKQGCNVFEKTFCRFLHVFFLHPQCTKCFAMFTTHDTRHTTHDTRHTSTTYKPKQATCHPHPINEKPRFLQRFDEYTCVPCVSYLYFKPFLGIWVIDRPHTHFWAHDTTLTFQKFFSENFSLRIKLFLKIFLCNFFICNFAENYLLSVFIL